MAVQEDVKQEFKNDNSGWLGVTVITGRNQDPKAIPVEPGGRIFLSREEQILTSRAYKNDEMSPFKNGLNAVAAPGEVKDDFTIPFDEEKAVEDSNSNGTGPEEVPAEEITGVKPQPAGDAAIGQQAKEEIAGTPEAQQQAATQTQTAPPTARVPAASSGSSVPKQVGTP